MACCIVNNQSTNCSSVVRTRDCTTELVPGEPGKQVRLADTGVSDQNDFEQIIVVIVSSIRRHQLQRAGVIHVDAKSRRHVSRLKSEEMLGCQGTVIDGSRLAIVLGFPSGGPRFESWGDASGFTPVVRGFLRIGGLLFGVTKVVVTAGGAIAVLTDSPSTNLTPPNKSDSPAHFRKPIPEPKTRIRDLRPAPEIDAHQVFVKIPDRDVPGNHRQSPSTSRSHPDRDPIPRHSLGHHRSSSATTKPLPRSIGTTPTIRKPISSATANAINPLQFRKRNQSATANAINPLQFKPLISIYPLLRKTISSVTVSLLNRVLINHNS
ncbi:hypothetical protein LXL04_015696 [Taraxacum kok-saghyz]